jgi:hypothetical protein
MFSGSNTDHLVGATITARIMQESHERNAAGSLRRHIVTQ